MRSQAGFTLIEMLIALFLSTLLAAGGWQLLEGLSRSEQWLSDRTHNSRALGRALAIMERDLFHMTAMEGQRAMSMQGDFLSFERGNWTNPLGLARSERLTVTYQLKGAELWRYTRGDGSSANEQRLLDNLDASRWRMLDAAGQWQLEWSASEPPQTVEVTFSQRGTATITRLFPLARRYP